MFHCRKDYNDRIQDSTNKITAEEPVFLLRGQDRFAYMAVKYYAGLISSDPSIPAEMVDAIRLHANKMYEWQSKYGKTPDCPAGELVRL